ncbi:DUF892 family protein [Pedobacter deserti]|uniref:DUF892 family protein n=1 Tax=Pedobacter deserti TaxID=2817382 RepID=UPI00210B957F|nr:DUF892 family protein [Pedobacter sp. SYSU D00382]
MKTPPINLIDVFQEMVSACYASEKKYEKLFEQLSENAATDELKSCLSPTRNELAQHVDRLAQILKWLKLRPSRIMSNTDETLMAMAKEACGYKKQQSPHKDVQILQAAKLITFHKISLYGSMEKMAEALKMENAATLLAQSAEDNRNAGAYFTQIEQNILYPAVASA